MILEAASKFSKGEYLLLSLCEKAPDFLHYANSFERIV